MGWLLQRIREESYSLLVRCELVASLLCFLSWLYDWRLCHGDFDARNAMVHAAHQIYVNDFSASTASYGTAFLLWRVGRVCRSA